MRAALAILLLCAAGPLGAQSAPADTARQAAQMLARAAEQLDEADTGRNRVRALTRTVQGYETGLSALRDGMRAAARREDQIVRDLTAREAEIGQLLGVLQAISRSPAPARLIHPAGPAGTARAGMIVSEITPGLQAEVETLRALLQEVTDLRLLQEQAAQTLAEGLSGAQAARTALSQAVADRTDLPRKFIEDPIQTAVLLAATDTLDSFAAALGTLDADNAATPLPPIETLKGELPLPVTGQVLRRAGDADAAGVTRPGILVATASEALVTTPVPATIRYAGPLLNYGLVAILEPQAETLFVLAGMAQVFGEIGEVLPAGDPVGLMAAQPQSGEGGGNTRPETLYIEVREDNMPVDPETWFQTGRE